MVANLLARGLLVGILAGVLAFGFARIFGEPQIDRAIALEEQMGGGHSHRAGEAGHDHGTATEGASGEEAVSRTTQAGIGLLTGTLVYGASMGGLFALVFGFVHGRVGRVGPRATAALLALGGFIAFVMVPELKYPANPPAVGHPDTIGLRTGLFFLMLAISVASGVVAVAVTRRLLTRYGAWNAVLAGAAAFIVLVAIAQYALPTINEVPEGFPADLLWQFRVSSLGVQVVLWATLGLAFGPLAERSLTGGFGGRVLPRPVT